MLHKASVPIIILIMIVVTVAVVMIISEDPETTDRTMCRQDHVYIAREDACVMGYRR